jgi:rhodanese-related sulfurtransferase
MENKNYFFIIIGILLILALIFLVKTPTGNVTSIPPGEFESFIESEEVFVINTHTPYIGEIEGTDLIAEEWDNMILYQNQLPEDKDTPLAIYCRSGRMAQTSAKKLEEMGYKNIYNLEGGMNSWQSSGREIVQNIEETGEIKEFNIIANNWNFIPKEIEVNLGDRVILNIKSVEGSHGIALFDFGINEYLVPEDEVSVEFIADKKGVFNFFCNVPCGHGHSSMGGQLIVK